MKNNKFGMRDVAISITVGLALGAGVFGGHSLLSSTPVAYAQAHEYVAEAIVDESVIESVEEDFYIIEEDLIEEDVFVIPDDAEEWRVNLLPYGRDWICTVVGQVDDVMMDEPVTFQQTLVGLDLLAIEEQAILFELMSTHRFIPADNVVAHTQRTYSFVCENLAGEVLDFSNEDWISPPDLVGRVRR